MAGLCLATWHVAQAHLDGSAVILGSAFKQLRHCHSTTAKWRLCSILMQQVIADANSSSNNHGEAAVIMTTQHD
jgi:hypothetical protein